MYLFDNRMVEGQPIHYYHHPFIVMEDEIPSSPTSIQSDSDNSLSSVEVSVRPQSTSRCCWRSCGITFDTLDQLAAHVTKVHAASGPGGLFYCGWEGCTRNNKGFNARYKMLVHVRTHTNEKPHQCYQCDKSFSRAENLKIHSRSHSGEKPYVCPVAGCNKAYSNSSDRFKHTRTHQVEKPYQCKVAGCQKRYTDPSSLRKHVKTYKHFVHQPAAQINNENSISISKQVGGDKVVEAEQNVHMCAKNQTKGSMFRLENLLNMHNHHQDNHHHDFWDGYYPRHSDNIFGGFKEMDVDMPLDLSVNRKIL